MALCVVCQMLAETSTRPSLCLCRILPVVIQEHGTATKAQPLILRTNLLCAVRAGSTLRTCPSRSSEAPACDHHSCPSVSHDCFICSQLSQGQHDPIADAAAGDRYLVTVELCQLGAGYFEFCFIHTLSHQDLFRTDRSIK